MCMRDLYFYICTSQRDTTWHTLNICTYTCTLLKKVSVQVFDTMFTKKTTLYMHIYIYIYHTNVSCTSLPISYHVLGTNGGGVGRKFGIFEEGRWPSHRSQGGKSGCLPNTMGFLERIRAANSRQQPPNRAQVLLVHERIDLQKVVT